MSQLFLHPTNTFCWGCDFRQVTWLKIIIRGECVLNSNRIFSICYNVLLILDTTWVCFFLISKNQSVFKLSKNRKVLPAFRKPVLCTEGIALILQSGSSDATSPLRKFWTVRYHSWIQLCHCVHPSEESCKAGIVNNRQVCKVNSCRHVIANWHLVFKLEKFHVKKVCA